TGRRVRRGGGASDALAVRAAAVTPPPLVVEVRGLVVPVAVRRGDRAAVRGVAPGRRHRSVRRRRRIEVVGIEPVERRARVEPTAGYGLAGEVRCVID